MAKNNLTQHRLKEVLDYNPDTGLFVLRVARKGFPEGSIAGTQTGARGRKYIAIMVDGRFYKGHNLAWFYHHGRWPTHVLDHINGDGTDNRLSNLREATRSQNAFNAPRRSHNTSGFKGVARAGRAWKAYTRVRGEYIHLGCFETPEAAHEAYRQAAVRLHGEFARLE